MRKPKLTSKELLRIIGDPEQVAKEMGLFARETIYLGDNYLRLLRLYPDRFVAIYDEKVVGTDKNLVKLINRLAKKNLNTTRVLIRFLATKPQRLHFCSYSPVHNKSGVFLFGNFKLTKIQVVYFQLNFCNAFL